MEKNGGLSNYMTLSGFPIKAVYLGCRVDGRIESFLKKQFSLKLISNDDFD